MVVMAGAALLLRDGVITSGHHRASAPWRVSRASSPVFVSYVVPIAVAILAALFSFPSTKARKRSAAFLAP